MYIYIYRVYPYVLHFIIYTITIHYNISIAYQLLAISICFPQPRDKQKKSLRRRPLLYLHQVKLLGHPPQDVTCRLGIFGIFGKGMVNMHLSNPPKKWHRHLKTMNNLTSQVIFLFKPFSTLRLFYVSPTQDLVYGFV